MPGSTAQYPVWKFVLTLRTGQAIGEVTDADERFVEKTMNTPATAGFKVKITHTLMPYLLYQSLYLKAYRDATLMFHGPVTNVQVTADDPTSTPVVGVGAADPSWLLEHRVLGKSATGQSFAGAMDTGTAMQNIISNSNSDGETGISSSSLTSGNVFPGAYLYTYKKASEVVADISNTTTGFDWRIDPKEFTGSKIGDLWLAGHMGTSRPAASFDYQGRANMRSPDYQRDWTTMANLVYSIHDNGPAVADGVRSGTDAGSINTHGLMAEVVDTSNITNATLRDQVLAAHILFRKNPRQLLSFQPDADDYSGRVPQFGTDYFIGDTVHVRMLYNQAVLLDGMVRIYKMRFDLDPENRETLTPTVVSDA